MDYIKLLLSFIAIERGGLPIHSSAVQRDGKTGVLFYCRSGGGKTTIARLMSHEWKVLSDEFNMIMPENGTYCIHSTPFSSPENYHFCSKGSAPAQIFYALSKGPTNRVADMAFKEKFLSLGHNIFTITATEALGAMVLRNMQDICSRVPMQRLFFIDNTSIIDDIIRFLGIPE